MLLVLMDNCILQADIAFYCTIYLLSCQLWWRLDQVIPDFKLIGLWLAKFFPLIPERILFKVNLVASSRYGTWWYLGYLIILMVSCSFLPSGKLPRSVSMSWSGSTMHNPLTSLYLIQLWTGLDQLSSGLSHLRFDSQFYPLFSCVSQWYLWFQSKIRTNYTEWMSGKCSLVPTCSVWKHMWLL